MRADLTVAGGGDSLINKYIYVGWDGVWVQLLGSQGSRNRVIFVLSECIWNAPAVSLVLPSFDGTSSLGFLPHRMVHPRGSTLGDCLPFPNGNKEA